ncbi:MAG: histidinol-phosphatase HisJ family protein [Candidatus Cloacimonetes bacterium]|nr:histidinol-phosphatase HisJ family protein [Candidatus Cloacimonadota bacterium]
MKIDYHLHADYSADSSNTMRGLARSAIDAGYGSIAFTEHFDFGQFDLCEFGLPAYLPYWREFDALRRETGDAIELLFGVEAGEYHRHWRAADAIFAFHPPEIIVASIHMSPDGFNYSMPLTRPITPDDIRVYYQENLDLAEFGRFDVLGHLGIWKRYLRSVPDESFAAPLIDEVLRTLVRRETVLEVNYSSLRKPLNDILPQPAHLARFRELGGRLITIGSDAHAPEQFDDHYDRCLDILRSLGFSEIFRKRGSDWEAIQI